MVFYFSQHELLRANRISKDKMAGEDNPNQFQKEGDPGHLDFESLTELLEHVTGSEAALKYQYLFEALDIAHFLRTATDGPAN